MCTPALRALHRRFPDKPLTVVGKGGSCALVKGLPYVGDVITLPERPELSVLRQKAREMRRDRAQVVAVFPHSFRAALLAWLARVPQRVGYNRNGRRLLLNHTIPPNRINGRIQPVYMAKEYLELVAAIGSEDDGRGLELAAEPTTVQQVRRVVPNGDGPLVGLAPGAAFGPSKRWLPERFAAVADRLHETMDARCVLLTGPGEEDTRDALCAAVRHPLHICDNGNPTIDTLKATISVLDLLICNDSGPRHVAVAFKVPTVCIMGSTAPVYSEGPYERGEVIRIDVDCGPCQKPECTTDHRCMTGISSNWVYESARRILNSEIG